MPGKLTQRYELPKDLTTAAQMFPKASSAALNRVIRSARTQVSRDIREVYNIKAKNVSDIIKVSTATSGKLTASLRVTGSKLLLILFDARQTAKGVTIMIKKGSRKLIPGSFLATMPTGHKGVFIRKGADRLPIKELRTIGLPAMFNSRAVRSKLVQFINDKLPAELGRTIKAFRELGRE